MPSAWALKEIDREYEFMYGKDEPWPYGVEPNRKTLETFVTYCHEQGITNRFSPLKSCSRRSSASKFEFRCAPRAYP